MKSKNAIVAGVLAGCMLAAAVGLLAWDGASAPESDPSAEEQVLQISEICVKNETILADNNGKHPDYIELYNPGPAMNLSGYTLTDGVTVSGPLGDLPMDTGEYRVVFLGEEHTGFSLGASGGDFIQLLDPSGSIRAQAHVLASGKDQVMLWQSGGYALSDDASPGFPNDETGVSAFRKGTENGPMTVTISEVLTANDSALPDENGVFGDVIELHNPTESPLRLTGWYLSDSASDRYRFQLPELTLPANGYLLLYCDGENYTGKNGEIHTNFGLSRGEVLCLTDSKGNYRVMTPDGSGSNLSLSLQADGTYQPAAPSLGFSNDEAGLEAFARSRLYENPPLVISEVLLSSGGVPYQGVFCDAVEIFNRSGEIVSTAGWYLTDNSDPYRFPLPEKTLAPGECMVIVCDRAQTGFSLSPGETLRLTAPNFLHTPEAHCAEPPLGKSISLTFSDQEAVYGFADITLGYENTPENHEAFLGALHPQGLRISEVMSANNSYLRGAYGTTCDWIELYNGSDQPVSLSGYAITDSRKSPGKYPLPDMTLAPGQYLCILLSEEGKNLRRGYEHIPMSLSSSGEELYLSKDGKIVDYVFLPELDTDTSYGRPSGSFTFQLLASVTPDRANGSAAAVSAPVVAVTKPGAYNGVEYVDVELSSPGTIYYTTNCAAPSRYARTYTGPIRITETTVFRVICYEEGKKASQVMDLVYLVNENDQLSVVSIVTEPGNLWDPETGMYVDGPGWTEEFPHNGANFWQNWERPATVTLLDTEGEGFTSVPCGLKIFGGFSRANAKKSLACMFRASYGAAELDYPLFGDAGLDSYEAMVLRAGGQDAFDGRIRDEVFTSFVNRELNIPVQKYKPAVVYLNGEYWGIHFIREKINENYVAGNFHVEKEDVTLAHWSGRDVPAYMELLSYLSTHKMSVPENYAYIKTQVNLENYTDYMIAQMWMANTDVGNVKYFTTSEHPWTWVLFDTDLAFRDYTYDSLARHLNKDLTFGRDISTKTLLVCLLENAEYRDYFIRRLAYQHNNIWTEEKLIAQIDSVQALIAQDMPKDCKRWHASYDNWLNSVERIRKFARNRGPYFIQSVQKYFGLTDQQMADYGFVMNS